MAKIRMELSEDDLTNLTLALSDALEAQQAAIEFYANRGEFELAAQARLQKAEFEILRGKILKKAQGK